jgi:hypothetical protein
MTDVELEVADSFERIFPVPIVTEDWDGVLDRAGTEHGPHTSLRLLHAVGVSSVLRLSRKRPGRTALAFSLVGAIAIALFVSTPWKSSPGFLERAQAALTPPAGSILHVRTETTWTSINFGCTVTTGPEEMWIDQTPPHLYRKLLSYYFDPQEVQGADPRALACTDSGTTEVGGTLDNPQFLVFEPPDTLSVSPVYWVGPQRDPDPVGELRDWIREAIANGSAHHEGKATLDGRVVDRIRLDPHPGCPVPPCTTKPSYVYIDPDTYLPVQFETPYGLAFVPEPGVALRFGFARRYLDIEYLPRTAANLALTDIRAQHPDATGP